MERLSDLTAQLKSKAARLTPFRTMQSVYKGQGHLHLALKHAETRHDWLDRGQITSSIKAAVGSIGTGDIEQGGFTGPVADAFLSVVRDFSIPMQLEGLRRVPPRTRIYTDSSGIVASEVTAGAALRVARGSWNATTLVPRTWGAIEVLTEELFLTESAAAQATLTADLAEAVGERENKAFLHPDEVGSITENAPGFVGSGGTVAQVDSDLSQVLAAVPASRKAGAAWCMPASTAQYLSLLRGSEAIRAYESITPFGGSLLGMPVFVTEGLSDQSSPPTSVVVLVAPSQIFYSQDQAVMLSASRNATIEMSDAPSGDAAAGTGAQLTSMFQAGAVAMRGSKSSAWFARSNSCSYFRAGY